jgi:hypothetical protein
MKSYDLVGYTYRADTYCPKCIEDFAEIAIFVLDPNYDEILLDPISVWAKLAKIDMEDEHSYDSYEFPKVILADQVEFAEYCGGCHNPLIEGLDEREDHQ